MSVVGGILGCSSSSFTSSAVIDEKVAGMTAAHSTSRGQAQVFARDVREAPGATLFHLSRGGAASARALAKAGLLHCPLDECSKPRFVTARGGTKVRDHFVHEHGAGGHAPETIAHHTAKHLIAAQLRAHLPQGATVHVDDVAVENGQIPDVYVTMSTPQRRVAYEVQLSPMTPSQWRERHEGYRALGIKDVWLFSGPHYDRRPRWDTEPDLRVRVSNPLFDEVLSAGRPLLFIDPFAQTVAYANGDLVEAALTARGIQAPALHGALDLTQRWPLADVDWSSGIVNPLGLWDLLRDSATKSIDWARVRQRESTAVTTLDKRALAQATADAEHRKRIGQQNELDRRRRTWVPTRAQLEARHTAPLPAVVDTSPMPEEAVLTSAAPDQWRWNVLEQLLMNTGFYVDPDGLLSCIPDRVEPNAKAMLNSFLYKLRSEGYINFMGRLKPVDALAVQVDTVPGGSGVPRPLPESADRRLRQRDRGNSRQVGALAVHAALIDAYASPNGPAPIDTTLKPQEGPRTAGQQPARATIPICIPSGRPAPSKTSVITYAQWRPQFHAWVQAQADQFWSVLPEHLHDAAKVLAHYAGVIVDAGPLAALQFDELTKSDLTLIVATLQDEGIITVERHASSENLRWSSTRKLR